MRHHLHMSRSIAVFVLVASWALAIPASAAQETPAPAPEVVLSNEDLHAYGLDWPLCPSPAVQTRGGREVDLIRRLKLQADQRAKIIEIQDELRRENWRRLGDILEQRARLRDLAYADPENTTQLRSIHERITGLRQEMAEARLDARERQLALLTDAQQENLRQLRRGAVR
jgi:Spy/CpxP family protein refolding chaperone